MGVSLHPKPQAPLKAHPRTLHGCRRNPWARPWLCLSRRAQPGHRVQWTSPCPQVCGSYLLQRGMDSRKILAHLRASTCKVRRAQRSTCGSGPRPPVCFRDLRAGQALSRPHHFLSLLGRLEGHPKDPPREPHTGVSADRREGQGPHSSPPSPAGSAEVAVGFWVCCPGHPGQE